MSQLNEFTPLNIQPIEDITSIDTININNIHNEMYLRMDNLLLDLIGQELTFSEVLAYLESKDKMAFQKLKCIALD